MQNWVDHKSGFYRQPLPPPRPSQSLPKGATGFHELAGNQPFLYDIFVPTIWTFCFFHLKVSWTPHQMQSVNKVSYREMGLAAFQLSATVSCLSCADHKVKCAVSKSSARNRCVEVSLRSAAAPPLPSRMRIHQTMWTHIRSERKGVMKQIFQVSRCRNLLGNRAIQSYLWSVFIRINKTSDVDVIW